jgi:hypothetical protein
MKHLDPRQIEAPVGTTPKRKRSILLWISMVFALCVGFGAAGTALLVPESQDVVTNQERQERQIAFTKVRELQAHAVPTEQIDTTLDEMRLPPTERAQLKALLASEALSAPANATTSPVATAAASTPLRLVRVSLWDSHAEDGDVVAVVSGGYRREVALTKEIQTVAFPVDGSSMVQIIGVRDGGGGITLGIRGPSQQVLMPILSEAQTLSLPIVW